MDGSYRVLYFDDEKENIDDEEDGDENADPSHSLLTAHEALHSLKSRQTFFSNLSYPNDDHFRALDSMHTLVIDLTLEQINKQTKIVDFFNK